MSFEATHNPVPADWGHDHAINQTITGFPGLAPAIPFAEKQKYVRQSIRYQLLNTNAKQVTRYINMRNCFKHEDRSWVDFCLKNKVPGVSIEQAAKELGYIK